MSRLGALAAILQPLKAWGDRIALFGFLLVAFALVSIERSNPEFAGRARGAASDLVAPVLSLLSEPSAAMARAIDSVREFGDMRAENERLRDEVGRLMQWQTVARRLDAENQELRALMNLAPDPKVKFVSARVVGGTGGAFVRSVLIAAGFRDGVRKNQPAITGDGLIGRVMEVGARSARVLLLTDINSRVPIYVERTRARAVLEGDNSDQMLLNYLPPDADIAIGDRIVTSGQGGIFPPGLPVGVVTTSNAGTVRVQPLVDWETMEYLRLVDYELSDLLLPLDVGDPRRGPQ
jgi:rod shape-determining protein MreC